MSRFKNLANTCTHKKSYPYYYDVVSLCHLMSHLLTVASQFSSASVHSVHEKSLTGVVGMHVVVHPMYQPNIEFLSSCQLCYNRSATMDIAHLSNGENHK